MLEDDITFSPALPRLTPSIIARLDDTAWDFIYFGHEETGDIPRATPDIPPNEFAFETTSHVIHTTHFYAVSGRIIRRVVAHLERLANGPEGDPEFGPMPIDGALHIFRRQNPDVRTFVAVPKLGWQRPSRSDIMPRRFDKIRIARPFVSAIRELKYLTVSRFR